MKTAKLIMLVIAVTSIGMLMPATASAYGYVSIGAGYHGHGWHHGYHGGHGYWGRGYWGPRFYTGVVFVDPYYYPPYPPVVVERPVVVRPEVTVLPQSSYPAPVYNGLDKIRQRKADLLSQLRQTDKAARLQAISELAGFSFDDQVKAALEKILLSDPDAVMRIEAALSFGKVKNQGALPILEKVRVQDSDREVREAADKAISQIRS